jgi:hypothetical protein
LDADVDEDADLYSVSPPGGVVLIQARLLVVLRITVLRLSRDDGNVVMLLLALVEDSDCSRSKYEEEDNCLRQLEREREDA